MVHFFNRGTVERLARRYHKMSYEEFAEGELPRRLFLVTMYRADI